MGTQRCFHRPRLEVLEQRLPPGDALLGMLVVWPDAPFEWLKVDGTITSVVGGKGEPIRPARISTFEMAATAVRIDCSSSELLSLGTELRATTCFSGLNTAEINLTLHRSVSIGGSGFANNPAPVASSFLTAPVRIPALAAPRSVGAIGQATRLIRSLEAVSETRNSELPTDAQESGVVDDYGNLPLTFEANYGQSDVRVDFIARTGDATVFLTPTAAVFSMRQDSHCPGHDWNRDPHALTVGHDSNRDDCLPTKCGAALHMQIVGANAAATPIAQERQPGIVNYFIGNDPSQWHANIPTFGRVEYQDVYPGIDLAYYGNDGHMEYDFIVSPDADPSAITLNFAGADGVEINPQGDLVVHTAAGDFGQQKPFTYQQVNGLRQEVASEYALDGTQVSFAVGDYESTRPLVIDPLVLGYSTYLGGNLTDDSGYGIAVGGGNAFLNGSTTMSEFPATPGAFDTTFNGGASDSFVAKLNANGSALAYSTYLGGSGDDRGQGIAVDAAGNAYVTGRTSSTDFPTTLGAFDPTYNGGVSDPFVVKLSADGSTLAYGTYIGGSSTDDGEAITVDGAGSAYVTGYTESSDFPTTPGAFDSTDNGARDAFVVKLSADGSTLAYGGYLGGADTEDGEGIAVDAGGNAYVTGYTGSTDFPTTAGAFDTTYNDAFSDPYVVKVSADGGTLTYGTYLGSGIGYGIAVDGSGNVYITGRANSADFPITPGAFDTSHNGGNDAFAAKLNAGGSTLGYATYLGGSNDERGFSIAVNLAGNAYVTGFTVATDFPTTPGAFDITFNGSRDAFVTKLGVDGSSLVYGTYLGGTDSDYGNGIAVDGAGNAYVTGYTASSNFPTTPGAYDPTFNAPTDAFVTKFCERACRVPIQSKLVTP